MHKKNTKDAEKRAKNKHRNKISNKRINLYKNNLSRKKKYSQKKKNTELIASVKEQNNKNLPILNFEIHKLHINSLIDSGASISLISNKLFEKLKSTDLKIHYLSRNVRIHTLNNSTIPFISCIKIKFKLGGVYVTGYFYVTTQDFPQEYQMIMGYDFLKENLMVLDCNSRKLNFRHVELSLNTLENANHSHKQEDNSISQTNVNNCAQKDIGIQNKHEDNSKNYSQTDSNHDQNSDIKIQYFDAICVNKEIFKPKQSKSVKIKCPQKLNIGQHIFIEPHKGRSGICIDYSVHKINESKQIEIIAQNTTDKKVTLNKHSKIGQIHTEFTAKKKVNKSQENNIICNNITTAEIKQLRRQELRQEDFDISHLDNTYQKKFLDLLFRHAETFSKRYKTLGSTNMVTPNFVLSHNYPIQSKPYKLPQNIKKFAKREIDELLDANIIERSNSNYSFPALFVKKKANSKNSNPENITLRMTIDFRLLNAITENITYPVPDIREILQNISGKKFYTVLDFHAAFFQIQLKPEDRDKLAFITEFGRFRPLKLPFGTKLSSLVWAELMDKVLGNYDKTKVAYFIDDVVIGSDSIEEMLQILDEILKTFKHHNLTIDPKKIQICKKEIEFLGFAINENGYSPSLKNREKVKTLSRPKNKKDILRFLGFANYFKIMLKDYSKKIIPLLELTKKDVKFRWRAEHENAFQQIQNDIISNPIVRPPDLKKDFYLITDASKYAISAILAQKIGQEFYPIEFYGRKLKDSERRYPSVKLELLGVHNSLMHFKNLLWGKKVYILTDSKCLTYHLNLEKQPDIVARWILDLQDFQLEFQHIKGNENPTDYLSRHIMAISSSDLEKNLFQIDPRLSNSNIAKSQLEDPQLNKIIKDLKNKKNHKTLKKYKLIENDIIILKNKDQNDNNNIFLAPEKLKTAIMQAGHKPHFAFNKTYNIIKERFYWTGMYQDIKYYCAKCEQCNKFKSHKTIQVPIQKMNKNFKCGESLHIDIIGRLPVSLKRNKWAITVIDTFSRYLEIFPVPNITTKTMLTHLNYYFGRFGLPKYINCDNAAIFQSKEFKEFCSNLGIILRFSSIYHPLSNGLIERTHRTLKESIASMCNKTYDWETLLPFYKLSYNDSKHRMTGFKPAELFFGRTIRTPFTNFKDPEFTTYTEFNRIIKKHISSVRKEALQNMTKNMEEYNKNLHRHPKNLNLGSEVYLKALRGHNTFEQKFDGPYIIKRVLRNNNYIITKKIPQTGDKDRKIHISKLFLTPDDNIN